MSIQLDQLNAQVTRQNVAIIALTEAIAKIPPATPAEDLGPVIDALKANNDQLEAAIGTIPQTGPTPV